MRRLGGLIAAALVVAAVAVGFLVFRQADGEARPRPAVRRFGSPALVNYYPARHPWASMWTTFNARAIRYDFERAHATGFDTVRIFLPPKVMGFPQPTTTMRNELAEVVSLAAANQLKVGLSLFDRYSSFKDLEGSDEWLHEILKTYASDPTIAFVELRNELDPKQGGALPWLRHVVRTTRLEAPRLPILVSSSGRLGPKGVRGLARGLAGDPADAYGLHYYGSPALLSSAIDQARKAIAPATLYLGEIGYSTSTKNLATPNLPATRAAQEEQQVVVISSAFAATRSAGLPPPGIWTLTDFDPAAVPPDVENPRVAEVERWYGLFREDGAAKPAADIVRRYLTADARVPSSVGAFTRADRTGATPLPLGWRIFGAKAGTLSWDGAVGHAAPGSARLDGTLPISVTAYEPGSAVVPSFYTAPTDVTVQPGRSFSAVVWARGHDATGSNRISLSFFDSGGGFLAQSESADLPQGTTGWTRLTVSGVAPKRAALLQLHLKSSGNDGTVWFDDALVN